MEKEEGSRECGGKGVVWGRYRREEREERKWRMGKEKGKYGEGACGCPTWVLVGGRRDAEREKMEETKWGVCGHVAKWWRKNG